jgi:hypothetical protein
VSADRAKELIDLGIRAVSQRPDNHLGIDRRPYQEVIAAGQMRLKFGYRTLVLSIGRVKEPDYDVRVERYSCHSSRN